MSESAQQRSAAFWTGADDSYFASKAYYQLKENVLRQLLVNQPRVTKAIDIGCGDGHFTQLMQPYAAQITGYDLSPALLAKARVAFNAALNGDEQDEIGNNASVEFMCADIDAISAHDVEMMFCFGLTTCLIDEEKFQQALVRMHDMASAGCRLYLIDSVTQESSFTLDYDSGYVARYRNSLQYLDALAQAGWRLEQHLALMTFQQGRLQNCLNILRA